MQRTATPATRAPAATLHAARGTMSRVAAGPFAESVGPIDDQFEREADRVANAVVRGDPGRIMPSNWSAAGVALQRRPLEEEEDETIRRAPKTADAPAAGVDAGPAQSAVNSGTAEAGPSVAAAPGLLVDDASEPGRGQMRKADFMAALRAEICASVDGALNGTGRDSQGCPWIDHWLGYYADRSPAQIERSLHRYAPEAGAAPTAQAYIPIVSARVRTSAETYARTGEIAGIPEDMPASPMAGGGVLGIVGGMFFKARPGGGRPSDPASVRDQLGSGRSLPSVVRRRMEPAFGASFAHVRFHADATAAQLSDRLNARAFTVGEHVAFGGGEYRPGTIAGDALIAHELAHVAQQARGADARDPSRTTESGTAGLERDADGAAARAVGSLWNRSAGHAMPRLRSGLQLQRCGSAKKSVEGPQAKAKLSVREQRDAAIQNAGERLRDVDKWASHQVMEQHVPGVEGVTNLDTAQSGNVAEAIQLLTKAQSQFATKELDALPAKLDAIVNFTKEARKFSGSSDELNVMQGKHALNQATDAATEAGELVSKLSQSYDVADIAKEVDAVASTLNDIQSGKQDILDGADAVAKRVKHAKELLRELRDRFDKTPAAISRVIFVLRSFLALNAPKQAAPPTPDEIKQFKDKLDTLSEDFSTVFAEGKVTQAFAVFVAYGEVLERQLKVREQMAAAGVKAESPVPTQGNAESFFTALKTKSNGEVFAAYTDYAQAYFFHRGVANLDDMNVEGVSELFERPLSIFGMRPLVCTGYALLGSVLLARAGARLKNFIVAVRATDDDVASDRIDEGHALAAMSRAGKDFFVSNHLIVNTKNDGIGPNAVAWDKSDAPLHEASGATIKAANTTLGGKLGALQRTILDRRSKQK